MKRRILSDTRRLVKSIALVLTMLSVTEAHSMQSVVRGGLRAAAQATRTRGIQPGIRTYADYQSSIGTSDVLCTVGAGIGAVGGAGICAWLYAENRWEHSDKQLRDGLMAALHGLGGLPVGGITGAFVGGVLGRTAVVWAPIVLILQSRDMLINLQRSMNNHDSQITAEDTVTDTDYDWHTINNGNPF